MLLKIRLFDCKPGIVVLICNFISILFFGVSFAAAIQDLTPHFSDEPTLRALKSVKTGTKLAKVINNISQNGSLSSVMSKSNN